MHLGTRALAAVLLCAAIPAGAAAQAGLPGLTVLQDPGGRVGWSRARDLIALDKVGPDGYFDVYTIRPDGADLRCLTCGRGIPQRHNGNPSWHPSGDSLVFQAQDPALGGDRAATPGLGINNNLWLASADGSRFWQLTRVSDRGGTLHPQFSDDGSRLLWSEKVGAGLGGIGRWVITIADVALEGGAPRLSNMRTLRPGGLQLYETHGFSPDGRTILYSGVPEGGFYFDLEIYALDLASGRVTRLTRNDEWDEHAHFTLDGRRIVRASSQGIPQRKARSLRDPALAALRLDYWIMNADGSNPRRLTRYAEPGSPVLHVADFDWGPDGRTVVAKIRRAGGAEVTVLITLQKDAP